MHRIPDGYKAILRSSLEAYVIREGDDLATNSMVDTWKWDPVSGEMLGPKPLQVWLKFIYNTTLLPYSGDGSDIKTTVD